MNYVIGIILAAAGVVLIMKTEWFYQNFGTIAWAEEHMATNGGTRLFYKLIGLILIFFGFLFITNMVNDFLMATVAKFFIQK